MEAGTEEAGTEEAGTEEAGTEEAGTEEAEEGAGDDMRVVLSGAYAETEFSARRRMAFRVAATALR